ncbi:hypothetical protein [uncultured Cellulomonas sp.]|uniref:hypothetical protein n=1 Tax=uncultured Cellulomonas sp. TaxID=189682 RepID=UPI0028E37D82|nr:hypothetical protein [uncultured Cellulomonas sp.]
MSMDFGRALDDIAAQAQGALRPVEVGGVQARIQRRRTQGVVVRSVGGVAVVGAVVASLTLPGGRPVTVPAEVPFATATVAPSPSPTVEPLGAVAGWAAGGAPCGAAFALDLVDDPVIEVQGGVTVGTLDRATAAYAPDRAGSTMRLDVWTTADVPGEPAGDGLARLTTMLVDEDGTVVFWSDPSRQIPPAGATDMSGRTSVYGLFDAVDCRTGRPLAGTYRVYAHDEGGPETVELAPVTFGGDGTRPAVDFLDRLPVCGQPVPAVDPDFTVTVDPAALEGARDGGLHAPVTLTATGSDRLQGRVPQSLHAVLVDEQGLVVTQAEDALLGRFDSGATFDVGGGESFGAEVFQWFVQCSRTSETGWAEPGTYDVYVYDVLLADDGSGTPSPRTAVGGPFPITLR